MLKLKALLALGLSAALLANSSIAQEQPQAQVKAQAVDLSKAENATFEYLLNEKLNKQKVIASAPGIPSRLYEMTMDAEDPSNPLNKNKNYHPAERQGWESMISQGRVLEKLGLMEFESGTFEELDYNAKKFKFTGFLMKFTPKAHDYIQIMPSLGRIGLRVGYMAVKKINSFSKTQIKNKKPSVTVSFDSTLTNKSPWVNDEYLKSTGIMSFVEGTTSVNMSFIDGKWAIDDAKFLFSVQNPVVDFE